MKTFFGVLTAQNVNFTSQILFWIIASTVAILTYRQARYGILQPIRTEVFKLQIEEIKNIIAMFSGKNEVDLQLDADIDNILKINTIKMFDDYASIKFEVKIDRDERPYNTKDCPYSIFTKDYANKTLTILDGHIDNEQEVPVEKIIWSEYEFGEASITIKHQNFVDKINLVISNPVIPSEIIFLLERYEETLSDILMAVIETLNSSKEHMENHYPYIKSLKNSRMYWIERAFTQNQLKLEPIAKQIIHRSRRQFDPDNLSKPR